MRDADSGCREFRNFTTWSRREALRIGSLAGLGVTLPMLFEQQTRAANTKHSTFGRAKQVICLFLHGGHPQQETFDPKPEGPAEVRGEFGAIPTSLPGVQFSEMLPRSAKIAHRIAIVRSMSHNNSNHVTACLPAQTGHHHPPGTPETDFPPAQTDFPPFGAVLDSVRRAPKMPTWVRIGPLMRRNNGTVLHGQTPGFLGPAHASFDVDQDLVGENIRIHAVERAAGLTDVRLSGRRELLTEFEAAKRLIDSSREARDLGTHYQRAFGLLTADGTQKAFDLAAEPANVRQRYGQTEFGQRCLLARRLAEAGVPCINVSYCHTPVGSWDTHSQNFKQMKESLGPTFDLAFTALVEDLGERGMLDETLVFVNAEFGRTPAINKNAGRDHWPFVYSLALAGAGIQAGAVYGASDQAAAYPTDKPHDPKDMAATIYHLLGIDPATLIYDPVGRSYPLVIGKPIDGILA
jgi:hypothetical protein